MENSIKQVTISKLLLVDVKVNFYNKRSMKG